MDTIMGNFTPEKVLGLYGNETDLVRFRNYHRAGNDIKLERFLYDLLIEREQYDKISNPIFGTDSLKKYLNSFKIVIEFKEEGITRDILGSLFASSSGEHTIGFWQFLNICKNPNTDKDTLSIIGDIKNFYNSKIIDKNAEKLSINPPDIIRTNPFIMPLLAALIGTNCPNLKILADKALSILLLFLPEPLTKYECLFNNPNITPKMYIEIIFPKFSKQTDFWSKFSRYIHNDYEFIYERIDMLTDEIFENKRISSKLILEYMRNRGMEYIPSTSINFDMNEQFIFDYLPKLRGADTFYFLVFTIAVKTKNIFIENRMKFLYLLETECEYYRSMDQTARIDSLLFIRALYFEEYYIEYIFSHVCQVEDIPIKNDIPPQIYQTMLAKDLLNRQFLYIFGNYVKIHIRNEGSVVHMLFNIVNPNRVKMDNRYPTTIMTENLETLWNCPTLTCGFIKNFPREYIPNIIFNNMFYMNRDLCKNFHRKIPRITETELNKEILLRNNKRIFAPNQPGYEMAKNDFNELTDKGFY